MKTGYNNTLTNEQRYLSTYDRTIRLVQKKYRQFVRTTTAIKDEDKTEPNENIHSRSSIDSFSNEEIHSLHSSNVDMRFPQVNNSY